MRTGRNKCSREQAHDEVCDSAHTRGTEYPEKSLSSSMGLEVLLADVHNVRLRAAGRRRAVAKPTVGEPVEVGIAARSQSVSVTVHGNANPNTRKLAELERERHCES